MYHQLVYLDVRYRGLMNPKMQRHKHLSLNVEGYEGYKIYSRFLSVILNYHQLQGLLLQIGGKISHQLHRINRLVPF